VGFGFEVADKDKAKKPAYLKVFNTYNRRYQKPNILNFKDIKLITSKNRHRFVAPGGVKKLTKEEFEAYRNQVIVCENFENKYLFGLFSGLKINIF
jgi:hypothetical protein